MVKSTKTKREQKNLIVCYKWKNYQLKLNSYLRTQINHTFNTQEKRKRLIIATKEQM